jgi:subfamily B ATP-binding cassette protein MsbA
LATPWPLKIIIDNVVAHRKMAPWLANLLAPWMDGKHQMHIAALAALAYLAIVLVSALATYVDTYFTESVGQYVAQDLRLRTFHHPQRLSLGYYNNHQTGTFLSTITTDIQTLIGIGVTPFLLLFVSRFKKAVKKATHQVRKEQSEIAATVQQALKSTQAIKAFGRQDLEQCPGHSRHRHGYPSEGECACPSSTERRGNVRTCSV